MTSTLNSSLSDSFLQCQATYSNETLHFYSELLDNLEASFSIIHVRSLFLAVKPPFTHQYEIIRVFRSTGVSCTARCLGETCGSRREGVLIPAALNKNRAGISAAGQARVNHRKPCMP